MKTTSILSVLVQRLAPAPGRRPAGTRLAGASFAQQEPDLVKEADLTAREVSGWAMAGSGVFE